MVFPLASFTCFPGPSQGTCSFCSTQLQHLPKAPSCLSCPSSLYKPLYKSAYILPRVQFQPPHSCTRGTLLLLHLPKSTFSVVPAAPPLPDTNNPVLCQYFPEHRYPHSSSVISQDLLETAVLSLMQSPPTGSEFLHISSLSSRP